MLNKYVRNNANGNVCDTVGIKISDCGVAFPYAKDVKQLYEYLYNGKYQ